MPECPQCQGAKVIVVTVYDARQVTYIEELCCPTCSGSGQATYKATKEYQDMLNSWCRCSNPSGESCYHPDSLETGKHHWTCADCGKVLQVG